MELLLLLLQCWTHKAVTTLVISFWDDDNFPSLTSSSFLLAVVWSKILLNRHCCFLLWQQMLRHHVVSQLSLLFSPPRKTHINHQDWSGVSILDIGRAWDWTLVFLLSHTRPVYQSLIIFPKPLWSLYLLFIHSPPCSFECVNFWPSGKVSCDLQKIRTVSHHVGWHPAGQPWESESSSCWRHVQV